jgi:hypothetical protein
MPPKPPPTMSTSRRWAVEEGVDAGAVVVMDVSGKWPAPPLRRSARIGRPRRGGMMALLRADFKKFAFVCFRITYELAGTPNGRTWTCPQRPWRQGLEGAARAQSVGRSGLGAVAHGCKGGQWRAACSAWWGRCRWCARPGPGGQKAAGWRCVTAGRGARWRSSAASLQPVSPGPARRPPDGPPACGCLRWSCSPRCAPVAGSR